MLFDLRGRGRRRTVQAIYLSLAILMGGGLVLFGIGGATPGGLVDAVTGSGGTVGGDIYAKQIERSQKQVQADPRDVAAWAALTRAQVQDASIVGYDQATGAFDQKGLARLEQASASWQRYLDLDPKKVDDGLASLMVNAYSASGLNDPVKAARALEVVIAGRGGSAALFTQLAVLTYAAGDKRKSLIAERRAVEASPKARRKLIEAQIASQRSQIDSARTQQAQQQAQQGSGLGG